MKIGANFNGKTTVFTVWAPYLNSINLVLYKDNKREEIEITNKDDLGYFTLETEAKPGDLYSYKINGREYPDPASRYQPEGVHGRSMIISPNFNWEDNKWDGITENPVIYELHVGAFGGDFDGVKSKLDYLKDLGIDAIELMPVSQFAGSRNWGYDGVLLYAVQNSYGGPYKLKELVNEAHKKGIGVIIDVVYNHVGPEGNYLGVFGPYFSSRYKTPWGPIFNFDEAWSDEVRYYVVQNAVYWIREYHADGLRLDAVHSIFDNSPRHIIEEIVDAVKKENKKALVIAESDLNDPKIILPKNLCGYGVDAQWSDDFHHSLHALLTKEKESYYEDFGDINQLVKAINDVFVYDGIYSRFRKKHHGKALPKDIPKNKFVIYSQNHDQVGNRKDGKRLISLIGEKALIAPFIYLLLPYIPMIFMGEEYGENNPFLFFTDFSDQNVINALREGRKNELKEYYYDPQDVQTFEKSRLSWRINDKILSLYKDLIKLRKEIMKYNKNFVAEAIEECVVIKTENVLILASFGQCYVPYDGIIRLKYGNVPDKLPGKSGLGAGVYIIDV
ncbi:malto-oligosyltrehalose trehalohydrolase [Acidianus sulfidivorans JP7]|uniref:Malto-oligosyltrehalose trehalohydrolase n=1 Tax=Acidianus sulfidivorans JP7 TaxID=619593 RepID=A0A2U9IN83_9CREN|nr:malto-oligosyltrehalose trehalohydrolase [Acidianus sulfidivorans]AWR97488.1 malto-oligosyltrehalose trehalohydrolase [Acidianus sulfidivorans JP7]